MWSKKDLCERFSLKKQYKEYNIKYFNGKLGDVVFDVFNCDGEKDAPYAYENARKKRNGGYIANISFNAECDWDERSVRETLLHEMIHYYHFVLFGRSLIFAHGLPFILSQLRLFLFHGLYVPVGGEHKVKIKTGSC